VSRDVGRRAAIAGYLHRLEQAQRLQPRSARSNQRRIEGVAVGDVELAADDLLTVAAFAVHHDALV